jgi:DNA-binding transcriptional regulator YiaG
MTPAQARARQPSAQCRPGATLLVARVVEQLASEGHPFPRFAGAVLAIRGRAGLDQATFGRVVGVPLGLLRALESGILHPTHAPPALAQLVAAFHDRG